MKSVMKSVWQKDVEMPEFPSLNGDAKTEVLIIGGGMTGVLASYLLKQADIPNLLIEKDTIGCGVTKNTTAKITVQHGLIYDKLLKQGGIESALMYLEANRAAFNEYAKLCKDISCDYEIKDSFVYSVNDRNLIEKEITALQKIGFKASFFDSLPIPVQISGAVCIPNQAQFNPLKLLAAISQRLNIREHTRLKELDGTTAITDKGKITAKKIIIATHFPILNKHGSYFLKLYQHRSYVIALKGAAKAGGMYLDEALTGLSFRDYGDYLLLGGGSHRTGKPGGGWEELRRFAAENYTAAEEEYFWATQDCMSLDGIPYIGRYSANTRDIYTASGFNKWGMTGAMLSALLLRDLISGKKNEFSELFSPSRSILKPQLLINGFEAVTNLLTLTSKRCPHLGCALKWNKEEHSWDCPCHGSRFTEDGKVINNPATGDIKPERL